MPWLSVIIPTYNGERYVAATLRSILAQNHDDLEVIVVDDGSTDTTVAIARSFSKQLPLTIIENQRVGNWITTTSHGLMLARGDYVSFLHQDDVWSSNRLSLIYDTLRRNPEIDLLFHPVNFINSQGHVIGTWTCPFSNSSHFVTPENLLAKLYVSNFISVSAPCIQRTLLLSLGELDSEKWFTADWKLWLQAAWHCQKPYYLSELLSSFRIHHSSLTMTGSRNLASLRIQLSSVLDEFYPALKELRPDHELIASQARFGVEFNCLLAALSQRRYERGAATQLYRGFREIGLSGLVHYFKVARVWQRIYVRLRAELYRPSTTDSAGAGKDG